ncbi:MAG: hypothetical protein ABR573_06560 [Candidatus Dormibacteria bacterium]
MEESCVGSAFARAAAACVALLSTSVAAAGCAPVRASGMLITPAAAVQVVRHHWDVNRAALKATSGPQARRLIEQVESGDALKIDEESIADEADTRAESQTAAPDIPDAQDVRAFVPRQSSYPAVFVSLRTQASTDRSGQASGKSDRVLELFRRDGAAAAWHNTAYAILAPELVDQLRFAVDRAGYAQFADGLPGGDQLSRLYSEYMTQALAGHTPSGSRVTPGPLSDQLATTLSRALALSPDVKRVLTFAPSPQQGGIKLRTADGGRFVLFEGMYDVLSRSASGGCITVTPKRGAESGPFTEVRDEFLQDIGALVAPGTDGAITIVAEFDGPVKRVSKPCAGGSTI